MVFEIHLNFSKPVKPTITALTNVLDIRRDPAFCSICANLDYEVAKELDMIREGLYLHPNLQAALLHATVRDVQEAAEEGCASCQLLVAATVHTSLYTHTDETLSTHELRITFREGNVLDVRIHEAYDSDDPSDDHSSALIRGFEVFTMKDTCNDLMSVVRGANMPIGNPCPWRTIGSRMAYLDAYNKNFLLPGGEAEVVSILPAASEVFERIGSWDQECRDKHPWCRKTPETPSAFDLRRAPSRLLYIGDNFEDIRLATSTLINTRYVALSHCWGTGRHLLLEKATLHVFERKIIWQELPKTFQDAALVTKKLGLDYIWIDSLCIIQDDAEDWAIEAANMASIYAGAWLTLSADAGKDGDGGLFSPRASTVHITLHQHGKEDAYVYARPSIAHRVWDWGDEDPYSQGQTIVKPSPYIIREHPLLSRGWTFQERLLAPRVLHFTADEIVWECLGMTACECGAMDHFAGSPTLRARRMAAGVPLDVEVRYNKLDRAESLAEQLAPNRSLVLPRVFQLDYALMHVMESKHGRSRLLHTEDLHQHDFMTELWQDLVSEYSKRCLSFACDTLPALAGLASRWADSDLGSYVAGLWERNLLSGLLWKCVDRNEHGRPEKYTAPSWSWASTVRAVEWIRSSREAIYHVDVIHVTCTPKTLRNPLGEVTSGELHVEGPLLQVKIEATDATDSGFATRDEIRVEFRPDSIQEARQLNGKDAFCLRVRTDMHVHARTQTGFERALVLIKRDDGGRQLFSRVGVVEYYEARWWEGAEQRIELVII